MNNNHNNKPTTEQIKNIVELAKSSIVGRGVFNSSGYFSLYYFEHNNMKYNLWFELSLPDNENNNYYQVYYGVDEVDFDEVYNDWAYTETLNDNELINLLLDISNKENVIKNVEVFEQIHSVVPQSLEQSHTEPDITDD